MDRDRQAIDWLIRRAEPGFADWPQLTEWLEADPRNAESYGRLAALDAGVAEHWRANPPADETDEGLPHPPVQQRWWAARRGVLAGAGAMAAAVAAMVGLYQLQPSRSLYAVSTPPGAQRTVELAGGTTIAMNGATRLLLDRGDPRFAMLEAGEARFDVVHDAARPFRVRAGDAELVDLGTDFNVLRDGRTLEVAVAEGIVLYNPDGEAVRLTPGTMLRATPGAVERSSVDAAAVGSWSERRLVYRGKPLAQVAKDLSRSIGKPITVEPALAARPVTAVVQLPRDHGELARRLEQLLGITISQTESGWVLMTSK